MAILSRSGGGYIFMERSLSHCVLLSALTYALSPTPHSLITHLTPHITLHRYKSRRRGQQGLTSCPANATRAAKLTPLGDCTARPRACTAGETSGTILSRAGVARMRQTRLSSPDQGGDM